jgi:hypothetical protein
MSHLSAEKVTESIFDYVDEAGINIRLRFYKLGRCYRNIYQNRRLLTSQLADYDDGRFSSLLDGEFLHYPRERQLPVWTVRLINMEPISENFVSEKIHQIYLPDNIISDDVIYLLQLFSGADDSEIRRLITEFFES